jgi:pyruvate kinase
MPHLFKEPTGEVNKDQVAQVIEVLKSNKQLTKGDTVIVLHGDYWGALGGTSTMRVVQVG